MGNLVPTLLGYSFYFLVAAGVAFIAPGVILLSRLLKKPYLPFFLSSYYCQFFMWLMGVKVKVSGKEHVQNIAYLILPNHQSFLDIPLIIRNVRPVSFLAKVEIKKWPLFGPVMERAHCIFVNRSSRESRSMVAPAMGKKMKEGVSFCVFPEGTRTRTGKLNPFKEGIFNIALENGIPILPVTIKGAFECFPKRPIQLNPGEIKISIHPPIIPRAGDSKESLKVKCQAAVSSALQG